MPGLPDIRTAFLLVSFFADALPGAFGGSSPCRCTRSQNLRNRSRVATPCGLPIRSSSPFGFHLSTQSCAPAHRARRWQRHLPCCGRTRAAASALCSGGGRVGSPLSSRIGFGANEADALDVLAPADAGAAVREAAGAARGGTDSGDLAGALSTKGCDALTSSMRPSSSSSRVFFSSAAVSLELPVSLPARTIADGYSTIASRDPGRSRKREQTARPSHAQQSPRAHCTTP